MDLICIISFGAVHEHCCSVAERVCGPPVHCTQRATALRTCSELHALSAFIHLVASWLCKAAPLALSRTRAMRDKFCFGRCVV